MNQKGITLVALIITVIVMVALAGVTIATISSQNGLMDKIQEAINIQKNAEITQQETLNEYNSLLYNYLNNTTPAE